MIDLNAPIDEVSLAFLDVETTGLRPHLGDRICEIAILRCEGPDVVDSLQYLVDPQRPMGSGAYAVHGISDEMLRGALTFEAIVKDVLSLLDGAVLVGHNARFDLNFLASELLRLHRELPPLIALDTWRLARHCYRLAGYGLGRLAQSLDIRIGGEAHRAMVDVLLTRAVMQRLIEDLWSRDIRSLGDYLRLQGGAIQWGPLPNLDIPPLIRDALDGDYYLYVRYRAQSGEETERLVRPLNVLERNGHLLLVAHCLLRHAQRSFRIDRILDAELVESFE